MQVRDYNRTQYYVCMVCDTPQESFVHCDTQSAGQRYILYLRRGGAVYKALLISLAMTPF